ncbi:hypothetical protein JCM8547_009203 [Rhodosporidiobolus lusitaniae]
MPDIRQRWASRFSVPAEPLSFFPTPPPLAASSKHTLAQDDEGQPRKRQTRHRFTAKDFYTPLATPGEVEEWFERFPCLGKRNHYVVQYHYATRDHFDLRLQLDGATTSWAIPKTLAKPAEVTRRLAVETNPHPIDYTLLEGSVALGRSTTGCWDLGTYTIHETKVKEKARQKNRDEGLSDGETTDSSASSSLQPEDERQEDLFRDAFYRTAFLPIPSVPGRPGQPQTIDKGTKRAFVVELNGERYRGLRLTFMRDSGDVKTVKSKRPPLVEKIIRQYILLLSPSPTLLASQPSSPSSALVATENPSIPSDRSLLSNRTMDEIRRDSTAWMHDVLLSSSISRSGALSREPSSSEEGEGESREGTDDGEGYVLEKAQRRLRGLKGNQRTTKAEARVLRVALEGLLSRSRDGGGAGGAGDSGDEMDGILPGAAEEDTWLRVQTRGWDV